MLADPPGKSAMSAAAMKRFIRRKIISFLATSPRACWYVLHHDPCAGCPETCHYFPQHVGAALNLAALHHRYGETGNAIELYRKAAKIVDPGDIDMIVMLR